MEGHNLIKNLGVRCGIRIILLTGGAGRCHIGGSSGMEIIIWCHLWGCSHTVHRGDCFHIGSSSDEIEIIFGVSCGIADYIVDVTLVAVMGWKSLFGAVVTDRGGVDITLVAAVGWKSLFSVR